MKPQTHYARSGNVHIAYQVIGEKNRPDLVLVPGWVSNIEAFWEHPSMAHFLNRLASFSRLILFDKRGTGLSDRVDNSDLPTLEERMDDVRVVMDAVGSERASLFGYSEGGPMCILFAATHRDRTDSLICYGTYSKRLQDADYPWAPSMDKRQKWLESLESQWGTAVDIDTLAPTTAKDHEFRAWWASFLRRSASPSAVVALGKMNTMIDVRDVLPSVRVPTLIIHRRGDLDAHFEEGRYIADRIPNARFILLEGDDHLPWASDVDSVLDPIQEILTGSSNAPVPDRVLMTVLMMDIVGSTVHLSRLGDQKWLSVLETIYGAADTEIKRFSGNLIKHTGDGLLAIFDGPARATVCACAIRDAVKNLKIDMRAGLHIGEIQKLKSDIAGIAVHLASRVMDVADPGEVWATSTIRDLVSGSGILFEEVGNYRLKGEQRDWTLCRVVRR